MDEICVNWSGSSESMMEHHSSSPPYKFNSSTFVFRTWDYAESSSICIVLPRYRIQSNTSFLWNQLASSWQWIQPPLACRTMKAWRTARRTFTSTTIVNPTIYTSMVVEVYMWIRATLIVTWCETQVTWTMFYHSDLRSIVRVSALFSQL